jgi:hypothetical protein
VEIFGQFLLRVVFGDLNDIYLFYLLLAQHPPIIKYTYFREDLLKVAYPVDPFGAFEVQIC